MVKLTEAKCPSCGATIDVNPELEKTICQYCGTTILIEDAVEKYKIEVSGKVKLDGVLGRDDKIKQAKKHMKIDEFDKAKKLLLEIIKVDEFDVEAYIELVKVNVSALESKEIDENKLKVIDKKSWELLEELYTYYKRIQKIDEDKISEKKLKDFSEKIEKYVSMYEQNDKEIKELDSYIQLINHRIEEIRKINEEYVAKWISEVASKYFDVCNYNKESFYNIAGVTIDGVIVENYLENGRPLTFYNKNPKIKFKNTEEVKQQLMKLKEATDDCIYCEDEKVKSIKTENDTIIACMIFFAVILFFFLIAFLEEGEGIFLLLLLVFTIVGIVLPKFTLRRNRKKLEKIKEDIVNMK